MIMNTTTSSHSQFLTQGLLSAATRLILVYILLYIALLGIRPLVIPDEMRYAEIPREMIESGDWTVPHLDGLRYFEKPPLGYWLNAVSIKLFGETPFAVRLPNALAAGLSALLVWLLLVQAGIERKTALTAAAVYLGLFEVLGIGNFAVLDTLFTLFLTGGIICFYLGTEHGGSTKQQRLYWLLSGLLFGLAFLTKGFLAFVVPGMVLVSYCLLEKRFKPLFQSIGYVALGLCVILPWAISVQLREPDFWHYFIWEEHIHRFLAEDAQHAAPPYYYLAALPILAFPWTAFMPAVVQGLRAARVLDQKLLRLLLLWFVLPFLFFSISKGKLATYILPCFAPLAIMTLCGVLAYLQSGQTRLFKLGTSINAAIIGLILAAFFYYDHRYGGGDKALFAADESAKRILMALLLAASLLLTLVASFLKAPLPKILAVAASVIPLFLSLNLALPAQVVDRKAPEDFFRQAASRLGPNAVIVSDSSVVHAAAWTLKRDDLYLVDQGELDYGLHYPEHSGRLLDAAGFAALLQRQRAGDSAEIALFCKQDCHEHIVRLLPEKAERYSNGFFTVWIVRR
jgi:4-amino-4-deoxy-L-arabinose transferase